MRATTTRAPYRWSAQGDTGDARPAKRARDAFAAAALERKSAVRAHPAMGTALVVRECLCIGQPAGRNVVRSPGRRKGRQHASVSRTGNDDEVITADRTSAALEIKQASYDILCVCAEHQCQCSSGCQMVAVATASPPSRRGARTVSSDCSVWLSSIMRPIASMLFLPCAPRARALSAIHTRGTLAGAIPVEQQQNHVDSALKANQPSINGRYRRIAGRKLVSQRRSCLSAGRRACEPRPQPWLFLFAAKRFHACRPSTRAAEPCRAGRSAARQVCASVHDRSHTHTHTRTLTHSRSLARSLAARVARPLARATASAVLVLYDPARSPPRWRGPRELQIRPEGVPPVCPLGSR